MTTAEREQHRNDHPAPAAGTDTDTMDDTLKGRYAAVQERIERAARRAGRARDEIILVAVTKYAEPEQIRELMALGHRDFGENRVQHLVQQASMVEEYISRHRVLPHAGRVHAQDAGMALLPGASGAPVRWHMIGHLQRNKVKKAIEFCRLIHSVDSLRLAEEIQQLALRREQPVEVLVQVNCSGEAAKFGCPVPAALHLAEQIETMTYVRVRGLMTMAPFSDNPEDSRRTFARCREIFEEIRRTGIGEGQFNLLSMGMSGDFEVAVEEGANIVRVGTAIFGEREIDEDDDTDSED